MAVVILIGIVFFAFMLYNISSLLREAISLLREANRLKKLELKAKGLPEKEIA